MSEVNIWLQIQETRILLYYQVYFLYQKKFYKHARVFLYFHSSPRQNEVYIDMVKVTVYMHVV